MEQTSLRPSDSAAGEIANTTQTHLTIVAALHIAYGAVGVLSLLFALLVVVGAGVAILPFPDMAFGTAIAALAIVFVMALALPGIIGGIGLLLRKEWARILLIVVAFIQLINIPFGTALGVYTLWALLQGDARRAMVRG